MMKTQSMGLIALYLSSILRPAPLVQGFASRLPSVVGRSSVIASALYSSSNNSNNRAESSNPFSSFVKDIMNTSLMGNSLSSQPSVDQAMASTVSWEVVRSALESKMETNDEKLFRTNLEKGYGVASPLHRVRLFDESNAEEDIRVVFYRDSASWCPYCQKVWLTLEEKRIPYRIEKVNMSCYGTKPAEFMRMQPSGQIPVAKIDGKVYRQSNDILYMLEESFPTHKSLQPANAVKAQELLRLERQIFSAWMYWLTSGGGGGSARLRQEFIQVLKQVECELQASGPFFMGKDVTTVDFMYASFLERMAASLLYYKGFMMRVPPGEATDYPALNRWFDAMETLESYQLTKSDYFTHCWDLPPQLGGCVSEPAGEVYRQAINGERLTDGSRGSWELPLLPHNGGVEPDWTWAGDEACARREAVERVSANHAAIVRFAARGAGRKGMPPVSAPLADPNAIPSEAVVGSVDAILRIVCMALLEGTDVHHDSLMKAANVIQNEGGKEFQAGIVDSLAYLRDRVGVPRDMKLPAARQLRAHLNWAIGNILDA